MLPALILSIALATAAPQLSPAERDPFLRVLSAGAGAPGRIACKDIDQAMQMKKDGLSPDAKAPVAWAANAAQIKDYLAEGKLVVSGDPADFKAGASIVITREHGKPALIIDSRNAAASGVTLSDTVLKIARRL